MTLIYRTMVAIGRFCIVKQYKNGGKMKQLNDTNFESSLTDQKTILLFTGRNCAACNQQRSEITSGGESIFTIPTFEVNLDKSPGLCGRFRILTKPKILIMKNKKVERLLDGFRRKEEICGILSEIE